MRIRFAVFVALIATRVAFAQTLDSVTPPTQRVHELITLRGSGFGTAQGTADVIFTDGVTTIRSGKAFVWRDNFIQVRVPVGDLVAGSARRIPATPLEVRVRRGGATSNPQPFRVTVVTGGTLAFRQLTNISGDRDISTVLGTPNMNLARSKDAEIGDVNGDGFPDILDNNSNNESNGTHTVLHLNNRDRTFRAIAFEPLRASESGTFAATIPAGGNYFADGISYDADLYDLDNDDLPDLIHTASLDPGSSIERNIVRILMNRRDGTPGRFEEQTATRLLGFTAPRGRPDDIDAADINNDGFLDFGVTYRTATSGGGTSTTLFFLNDGTGRFPRRVDVSAPGGISTHDVFFIDANNDRFEDIVLCHEWDTDASDMTFARTTLYLHNGDNANPAFVERATFSGSSATGEAADFNGDGLLDFATAQADARVFLNNPAAPGTFTEATLPDSVIGRFFYDLEMGDVDLDGDVDIVGAVLIGGNGDRTARVWLNDGNGNFTNRTSPGATALLPGAAPYQRLSADLLDFDNDGDLDLYLAGADDQSVTMHFGDVPNQFWENLTVGLNILAPSTATPAYGGDDTTGRSVLVRVAASLPLATLSSASFTVSLGGTDLPNDAVAASSVVAGEFWLVVRMPPRAAGCYDLGVRLRGDPLLTDTERRSVCFQAGRAFSRALAIDRTGSMNFDSATGVASDEKMQAARNAARLFIDLSADNDRIGVTSFKRALDDGDGVIEQNELARVDFTMRPALNAMTDERPAARAVIAGIRPDGMGFEFETAIGAGLLEAFNMLGSSAAAGQEREIVLLSDGRENLPPFWRAPGPPDPLAPAIIAAMPRVRVHTVAIGRDAGNEVLEDIARSTGGNFWNLIEGTGSFGLRSRLANVYKYIDENIRDEQRFFYAEGIPDDAGRIPVEEGLQSMTIAFHWDPATVVTIKLIAPDGSVVMHAPPATAIYDDITHRVYQIAAPRPGIWVYRVELQTKKSPSTEFFAAASGVSEIVMHATRGTIDHAGGGTFSTQLYAMLADFKPIRGATVTARVRLPSGSYTETALYDDGTHGDHRDRDGLYAVAFTTSERGAHSLEIRARGASNKGLEFERARSFSFVIPGRKPKRRDSDLPYSPKEAQLDRDGDGLTNAQEHYLGTNPDKADTDGDGRNDGVEAANCNDPLSRDKVFTRPPARAQLCLLDIDFDQLTTARELELKTNPLLADSDGDGFPDFAEVFSGTDPNDPKDRPRER